MTTFALDRYDITQDLDIQQPLDFTRTSQLKHVDKTFKVEVTNVVPLTANEKLFHLRIVDPNERKRFTYLPGQFVMLEVPGYGEVPISISSSPSNKGYLELCIRRAGTVTGVLHKAERGAKLGIRGPFGTHFPVGKMKRNNVLLIAGGLGLAPLRAPIFHVTENRADYDDVHILYGARRPSDLLFDYQYDEWRRIHGVGLQIIVQEPDASWKGRVGLITALLDDVAIDPAKTYAIVCGPPAMFKFVCKNLSQRGLAMDRMFVSLERRMHCGMGKCCRCNVGSTYTCLEGPVFDYWTVMNLKEAI